MELFSEYPVLEDDGLILKKMTIEDAESLRDFTHRKAVYSCLPTFLYELKYDNKQEVIERMDAECFDTKESILLGIYLKLYPDRLAGIAEIYNYEEDKSKASIGCRLSDKVWGRGVAARVIALLRDYLIKDVGLETVTAHIMSGSKASERSAAKCGFVKEHPDLHEDWGLPESVHADKYVFRREWLKEDTGRSNNAAREADESAAPGPEAGSKGEGAADSRLKPAAVEKFVLAYAVEQDRIRAMLPEAYTSLRPVLRINTEIIDDDIIYVELNTPVSAYGRKGWLNIANWSNSSGDDLSFKRFSGTVTITSPFLRLTYTPLEGKEDRPAESSGCGCATGMTAGSCSSEEAGCGCSSRMTFGNGYAKEAEETAPAENSSEGCPAEKDNDGCYYIGNDTEFRPAEKVDAERTSCDIIFSWRFNEGDAKGISSGKMVPAFEEPVQNVYDPIPMTAENAAAIPCRQVLGAYMLKFERYRQ